MHSGHYEPLNMGQDRMVSMNQFADMVAEIAGVEIIKKHVDAPQGVRGCNSDNTRLRQVLNWEPQISLEEGIKRTYEWIEEQAKVKISQSEDMVKELAQSKVIK
jgi:GDP-D-mannose 3',5'-epimerase